MAAALYNPLEKLNLARSIEAELLSHEVAPLDRKESFSGAGVYVIYYSGSFELYAPLKKANAKSWMQPIYVGKAIPKGGRKGGMTPEGQTSGSVVFSRLRKHSESIKATANLDLDSFVFRWIELDDIWIPLGENILIETFKPLWNIALDGFGINDPGKGRLDQKRSAWDILHPGRSYASRLKGGDYNREVIAGRVDDFFNHRSLRPLPKLIAPSS